MSSAVQPGQRIQYLDIIRGFAITGVLFAYVFWNLGTEPASTYTVFDNVINEAGYYLIDSKCYTLLATLFAIGFVLHMDKAGNKETNLYTYRRRLLGLFIMGAIHALLLRNGDILAPYAITAFIVTFFYNSSNKMIIILMVSVLLLQALLPEAWFALGWPLPQRPQLVGNYLVENFAWVKYWYATSIFFWETTLFLLFGGLLIGRALVQKKQKLAAGKIWLIAITGFCLGTLSYLVLKFYHTEIARLPDIGKTAIVRQIVYSSLDITHKLGLASGYACAFYFWSRKFPLSALANLGRMSLTNYVLQAAIIVPTCLIFNLFDHIKPTIALAMTAVIWVLQVLFSNWWLRGHQFGPLEWLLRTFTYGRATKATNTGSGQWSSSPAMVER